MGLHPDVSVAKRTFGLGVGFTGLARVAVIFHSLIHRHVVWQESLTHEKLQLVSCGALAYEHCGL